MSKFESVDAYIVAHPEWKDGLKSLQSIIEATELTPSIKWNAPVYTIKGQNVLGIGAFKSYFGLWFYNGVFLKDPQNLLINAQENKTKALRQMRFTDASALDLTVISSYISEAITNEKAGKKLIADKTKSKNFRIPELLLKVLEQDQNLSTAFKALTPFKQKEFCEYIESAKRETTQISRMEKIKPMIRSGIGLNDKYRA